jgi:signal peptidase II
VSAARRFIPVVTAAVVVLLLDQWSKNWAEATLDPATGGSPVKLVGGLEFRFAQNQGMAFSRFSSSGPIIGAIAVAIVVALLLFARTVRSLTARVIIGIVIGGALGNLADRLVRAPAAGNPNGFLRGAVVDFVWTSWYPTFNLADAAIVVGGISLAILAWRTTDDPDAVPDPERSEA